VKFQAITTEKSHKMKPLIDLYISEFHARGESAVKDICNLIVPKSVFLNAYKTLPPIPENEVEELMAYASELYPDKNHEEKSEIIKIIYSIGTLI
jgi:hypothetical protein